MKGVFLFPRHRVADADRQSTDRVRVDVLYGQLPWALAANVLVGVLLGVVLANPRHGAALMAWGGMLCLSVVLRGLSAWLYVRRPADVSGIASWERLHLALTFFSGLVWGSAAPLFFSGGAPSEQLAVAFAQVGMTAGAVASLSAARFAFAAYLVPTLLPLMAILLSSGDRAQILMGSMVSVYMVVMFGMARRLHETLVESLRLRFSNDALVSSLQTTFSKLEDESHSRAVIERAAQELQQRLRLHIEQTPLAAIDWDAEFKVAAWNPAAEQTFGYTRQEALGRHALDLLAPPHGRDELWLMWLDLLRRQGGARWSGNNRTKDGRAIVCEWYNTPLLDSDGRLLGVSSLVHDVTERREAEQQIQRLANYDVLTGLPNRNLFHDRFSHAIDRAKRRGHQLALLFIDLNNFKIINDTLGHDAGDQVLQHAAVVMQQVARDEDTVARLGSDEFVVLMEATKPLEVPIAVERLLEALGRPLSVREQEVVASASVGIAIWPNDGDDMATLEKNADTAMYRAKERGEPYQFFHQEMAARSQERLTIETNLRRAIERGQLFLNFQPIINLDTGELQHAEALLRWRHPELGLVPPDQFIPVAEASGLIASIGEWVLRETCRQIRAWEQSGLSVPRIAVNLSARQLRQRDMSEVFARILAEEGVSPARIGVELTESSLMQNADEATAILGELRSVGFEISVDDFGTGYSSLGYLKRFPIDKLKIDRSFVKDLSSGSGGMAIVTAVLGVARALSMRVVAEGIETEAQLGLLRANGCDMGQGYYLARPMMAEDFAAWARKLRGLDSAA